MEPRIADIAGRIRSLREDSGLTLQEMAEASGLTVAEYSQMEAGEQDPTFTVLYRCAEKLGVDIVDLLTGEGPHLTGYSVVRSGRGLSMKRRAGFEYQHLAPTFKDKLAEPFFVTAPFSQAEQDAPIALSRHAGQEFDYIVSGTLRFAYDGHVEELAPGDAVYYDSGRGHGMIAVGGEPCTFLAIVLKDRDDESL
ncbi:MAG: XRE family transcriptional regulator [Coriobacteriia bacterium]|nr:XRE family transcriptional regulator [Coriobacteriia bacterium]